MSYQKQFIEISPPKYGMEEMYSVCNHKCNLCKGRGAIPTVGDKEGNTRPKTCKRCDGTGTLKAVIKINWTPDS